MRGTMIARIWAPVRVTIGSHTYRTTVGVMGGKPCSRQR
jgi:hypothetical protein